MTPGVEDRPQASQLGPHLPGLRAELEEQRDFRLEQLEELGWAIDTAEDEARLEVNLVLTLAAGSALEAIESALERLAAGTYGRCATCAGSIALERLEVLPMAALCTLCQYRAAPTELATPTWMNQVLLAAGDRS